MTATEFEAWARNHCQVFGLSSDESKTVLSWEPYFVAAGFHHHDLEDTTAAFAKAPSEMVRLAGQAKFLGKCAVHLAAIEAFLREQTARTNERASEDFEAKHGACGVCRSTGFAIVPHLRGITAGRWVGARIGSLAPHFYTCAVLCSCALGRWKAGRQGGKHKGEDGPRSMTLEAYEIHNPGWREQMDSRAEAALEKQKLCNPSFEADIAAALKRFKLRKEA